jgi:hypothetical protein
VVLDRARAEEQPGMDPRVRQPLRTQACRSTGRLELAL